MDRLLTFVSVQVDAPAQARVLDDLQRMVTRLKLEVARKRASLAVLTTSPSLASRSQGRPLPPPNTSMEASELWHTAYTQLIAVQTSSQRELYDQACAIRATFATTRQLSWRRTYVETEKTHAASPTPFLTFVSPMSVSTSCPIHPQLSLCDHETKSQSHASPGRVNKPLSSSIPLTPHSLGLCLAPPEEMMTPPLPLPLPRLMRIKPTIVLAQKNQACDLESHHHSVSHPNEVEKTSFSSVMSNSCHPDTSIRSFPQPYDHKEYQPLGKRQQRIRLDLVLA